MMNFLFQAFSPEIFILPGSHEWIASLRKQTKSIVVNGDIALQGKLLLLFNPSELDVDHSFLRVSLNTLCREGDEPITLIMSLFSCRNVKIANLTGKLTGISQVCSERNPYSLSRGSITPLFLLGSVVLCHCLLIRKRWIL